MIEFILKNKEWLFSGLGVTVLIAIIALVKKSFSKKITQPIAEASPNMTIHLNLGTDNNILPVTDEKNIIPLEKLSSLSFSKIGEMIEAVPPLQRDETKKHFVGIKVSWDGYLKSASQNTEGIVTLRLSPGNALTDGLYTILCQVALDDYRELSILPKGSHIRIDGEIIKTDKYDVELSNVKLYFFENNAK